MDRLTTYNKLNDQLEKIPKAQIRSLSLAVLPRLMGAIDNQKEKCHHCEKFNDEGEKYVNNIQDLFNDPRALKPFENWVEQSQQHLKQEHHLHVKGRIGATYSTVGMLAGILLPAMYVWLSSETNYMGFVSVGWLIGLTTGYVAGKIVERRLSKENKLY
ncbi:hypothetical protein [Carboxylicivirga linearis]|uniref:Uncharacterized protein n=1 Tax=Carboxylicivirga linearis TaxID=1628157 RepID=A0ABS5JT15_9BACT|nr:hypothetical protein [Carboxylicivirga linearis]MBS2097940.1 hypothetical protein [Carboxylicivirga linearis]